MKRAATSTQLEYHMNKQLKWMIGLFALIFTASMQAQTTQPANKNVEHPGHHAGPGMAKELNLSKEQKAAFDKIDQEYKVKHQEIKKARKAELEQARKERQTAHKAVLNAEQAKKYNELVAERKARKEAHKAERKAEKKTEKAARKPKEKKPVGNQK